MSIKQVRQHWHTGIAGGKLNVVMHPQLVSSPSTHSSFVGASFDFPAAHKQIQVLLFHCVAKDKGADPGPHGRLAVKLDGSPPATHTAGVSVDGYTLTLAANPPLRLPLPAWHGLQLRGVHVRGRQRLYGSFVGDQGAWSTAKMYFTVPPNGVAKLHFGAHFQAPGLPNQTAGTVDVYGLQILDATLETGNTAEVEEDTAASALLNGGADDVTLAILGEALLEPTLTTLGIFLVRSNSQSSVAFASFAVVERLRLEHCAHLHADAGETLLLRLPVQAGHGLQLGDVRQFFFRLPP